MSLFYLNAYHLIWHSSYFPNLHFHNLPSHLLPTSFSENPFPPSYQLTVAVMVRPFEQLKDFNDSKELWKVVVRVHHKWFVVSNGKEHFEAIVFDKSGTDIHVVIPPTIFPAFKFVLAVGHTYSVSNFKVISNDLVFKPSSHPFVIKFTGGTSCGDIDKHDIPPKKNRFTPNELLHSFGFHFDGVPLFKADIIGVVDFVGFSQTKCTGKKQHVNFTLRDITNNTIKCTLWESYASQFMEYNQDKGNKSGPIVILLEYVKVKEEGKYPVAITNTYNVTKLSINDDIPPINDFIISMPKDFVPDLSGQLSISGQLSSTPNVTRQSPFEKLLSKFVVLPLTEIIKLPEVTFCSTVATTKKIMASQYGWYYQACHECPKVARGKSPPFTCDSGHSTETSIFRYKLEIEVSHRDVCCKFVFWDRECTELLGVSAAQMRDAMIDAGVTDPLEFPLALDSILGLEMAYKVKWQPRWDSCSVVIIVRDTDVVRQLKSPWEPNMAPRSEECVAPQLKQIKESVDEAKCDGGESCEIRIELEITCKHIPEPTTPDSKRKPLGSLVESGNSSQLSAGNLSSNKL